MITYSRETCSYREAERKLGKKGKLAASRLAEQFRENLEARSWRISRFGLEVEAGVTAMSLRRAVHVGKETACSICYNEILSYTVHLTFCFFILPNWWMRGHWPLSKNVRNLIRNKVTIAKFVHGADGWVLAYVGHMHMCDRVTHDHGKCNLIYACAMCMVWCVYCVWKRNHMHKVAKQLLCTSKFTI